MAGRCGEIVRMRVAAARTAAALTACSGTAEVTGGGVEEDFQARFEARVVRLHNDTGLTGVVAAVMTDGRLAGAAASGERRRGSGIPVTVDDGWHIGSITKSITATLLAVLEDDALLSADDPVAALLPEVEVSANRGACTLHHLLTHTSGRPSELSEQGAERLARHGRGTGRRAAPFRCRRSRRRARDSLRRALLLFRHRLSASPAISSRRLPANPAKPAARARVRPADAHQRRLRCATRRGPEPGADRACRRVALVPIAHRPVQDAGRQLAGDGPGGYGAHDDRCSVALRCGPPGGRIRSLANPAPARGLGAVAYAGSRRLCARPGPRRTRLGGRPRALAQRQQHDVVRAADAPARSDTVLAFATNDDATGTAETAFVELARELGGPGLA